MATGQRAAQLPDLLLERSLGGITVPALLRAAGLTVHTLVDVYGPDHADRVADSGWLRHAGVRGWPVLMKDQRIRYRPTERAVLAAHRVTAFCLTGDTLTARVMAGHFLTALDGIARACASPGPALHLISASRMRTLPLD